MTGDAEALRREALDRARACVVERDELARDVVLALKFLSPRYERVVAMRYGLHGHPPMTFREIAEVEGVCRHRVWQIHQRAMTRLRMPSTKHNLREWVTL